MASVALIVVALLAPRSASAAVLDRIPAVVNNEIISLSDLRRYEAFSFRARDAKGDDEKLLGRMIDDRLLLAEARRFETEKPLPAEVDQAVQNLRASTGGDVPFQDRIKSLGLSVSAVRVQVADDLLVQKFIDERINFFVFIRPEDVERYYDDHAEDFKAKSLDEAAPGIQETLKRQISEKRLSDYLATLRTKSTIRLNSPAPR